MRTMMRTKVTLAAAAVAVAASACDPLAPGPNGNTGPTGPDGAVVSGFSFSRSGTVETHYVECTTPADDRFKVAVPAEVEAQLLEGAPCPDGPREPLAIDQYPELYEELTKRLPYGGGDIHTCGEWQTVDKEEARRMAKQCPPLKWGDLG